MATSFSIHPEFIKLYMIYIGTRRTLKFCLASDDGHVDGIPLEIIEDNFNTAAHALAEFVADNLPDVAYLPSPTTQGCTPEGGVSANRTDDNSSGGVTTPEVTWRASGHSSEGGAHE